MRTSDDERRRHWKRRDVQNGRSATIKPGSIGLVCFFSYPVKLACFLIPWLARLFGNLPIHKLPFKFEATVPYIMPSPSCKIDRDILNEQSIESMDDIALSFFASTCGKNRGAFVLDPPDGNTYGWYVLVCKLKLFKPRRLNYRAINLGGYLPKHRTTLNVAMHWISSFQLHSSRISNVLGFCFWTNQKTASACQKMWPSSRASIPTRTSPFPTPMQSILISQKAISQVPKPSPSWTFWSNASTILRPRRNPISMRAMSTGLQDCRAKEKNLLLRDPMADRFDRWTWWICWFRTRPGWQTQPTQLVTHRRISETWRLWDWIQCRLLSQPLPF